MDSKQIKRKAIWGLIATYIIIPLCIFLPAWSLNYLQGWVFFIVFFATSLLITLYFLKNNPGLVENRSHLGPTEEINNIQKVIQSLNSIFFIGAIILPGFDHRYGWSSVPLAIVLISDVLVVIGFWIVFLVLKDNSYASNLIKVDEGQKVIDTGTYSVVRHPMYSGGLMIWLFTPLALGSYWAMLFSAGAFVIIIIRLFDEEKYLKKNLVGYSEYCDKTKYRLIPGIW